MKSKVPAFAGTTLAALLLTACSTTSDLPAGPAPFDPIAFFTGVTNGEGSLDTLIASPVPVTVSSLGLREHGGLKLIQRITEGDKPLRVRTWTMKPVGRGRYTGTLTDAEGPVSILVDGPRADIAYVTPSGLRIRQQLALQSDGVTVLNRLTAHKYGVRLALLDETIRK
ncbi:MAG TPA: DUF3833 domain-containing protein [Allosphingosinicella sp.]|nr:DUF3833 domain-containing protein [Allosphingosinicella sp.]